MRERQQFGAPLAGFQAVRHRLADVRIAETAALELLDATGPDTDASVMILVVKAAAGRAALLSAQAAQQVCGAMGFTEEFGLHRFVRRIHLLDSILGGAESADGALGSWALRSGRTSGRIAPLIGQPAVLGSAARA